MNGSRLERVFTDLLRRDPAGGTWLPGLLRAAPRGRARLGELVEAPGWLVTTLAVPAASGRLGAFEQPAMPSRELERWLIDHPEELVWPAGAATTAETQRLRRALLLDDPPGSRARAQGRARELARARSALAREWWRFEDVGRLDCVLSTDRLVITIADGDSEALEPSTPWYPPRSRLVRDLEAARQLADGRAWGGLLLSERPIPDARDAAFAAALPAAAPHLDGADRAELQAAFLGNLIWDGVGFPAPSRPLPAAE